MNSHAKVVIIGAGPAGYTAAIYAGRALFQPVQFAGVKAGGQLMYTTEVENFPGFENGINGPELMFTMRQQAERFGATIHDQYVVAVDLSQRPFKLWTTLPDDVDPTQFETMKPADWQALRERVMAQPADVTADAVIIATGAVSKMLGIPGEHELLGRGVSTCAVCDAAFYREKNTFVIGGGDSAMEDALALSKFAKSVTIVHRRDSFRASKIMQERVLNHSKIKVLWNTEVLGINGAQKVEKIKLKTDGQVSELDAEGVFMAIGHQPMTQLFADQLKLDAHGFVVTRHSYTQAGLELAQAAVSEAGPVAFPSMTSVEGVFAAGDVVDVRYWQAITSAGQGCMAAIDAERWLEMTT